LCENYFVNVIDPLKAGWLIYVPPGLRQRNSTLFLRNMFVVCGSQDKQRLLRYTTLPNCILNESKSVCLLRGTNRHFKNSSCFISSLHF